MPTEVLTSFTKVDPSGRWTVTATTSTGTGIPRNEDSHVSKSYGAGHFTDFTHHFRTRLHEAGSTVNGVAYPYALANSVDDQNNAVNSLGLYWNRPNTPTNRTLNLRYDPTGVTDSSIDLLGDTDYYPVFSRTADAVTVLVYSDAAHTTLLDTLSITAVSTPLEFLFAGSSWNSGSTSACSVEIGDLDLNEGGTPTPPGLVGGEIVDDGTAFLTEWDEALSVVNNDPTLTLSGGPLVFGAPSIVAGNFVSWPITNRVVQWGETVTAGMDLAAGAVEDAEANGNDAIDDFAITNNSKVGGPFPVRDFRADAGILDSGGFGATDTEDVDEWVDSSWMAQTASAPAAANRPYCVVENSIPSVRGWTSGVLSTGAPILGTATEFLETVVFRQGYKPPSVQTLYSEGNSAAVHPSRRWDVNTNGTVSYTVTDAAGDTVFSVTSSSDCCTGRPITATVQAESGSMSLTVNDVEEDITLEGIHDLASATFDDTMLFARVGSGSPQYSHADLFAVISYTDPVADVSAHNTALMAEYADATRDNCIGIRQYSQELFESALRYDNKYYYSWANELGHAGVTVKDLTGLSHYLIATGLSTDWHNSTTLVPCSDGRFLAFHGQHNGGAITQWKTTNPNDVSLWGSGTVIENTSADHAYFQASVTQAGVNNHRIRLFWRNESIAAWEFILSDDDGVTWTAPNVYWQPTNLVAPAKLYATHTVIDNEVHIAATSGWRAHTAGAVDLHHMYFDDNDGGKLKATDGTEIALPATDLTATKVYDSSDNGNQNPDAASNIIKVAGNPWIGFGTGRRGYRARWDGVSSFTLDLVIDTGVSDSVLNVAPSPFDNDTVYYAIDDWVPGGTFPGTIYESITPDGGATFPNPTEITSGQHHGYTKGVRLITNGTPNNFLRWQRGVDQAVTVTRFSWMTFSWPLTEAETYTASGNVTLSPITASGSAQHTAPQFQASASLTLSPITAQGSAQFATAVYLASGSVILQPVTAVATAQFTPPVYTGEASVTITPITAQGSAIFSTVVYLASASIILQPLTVSGLATFTEPGALPDPSEYWYARRRNTIWV